MEKWEEKHIKRQIEEVITESYLLCLGEREVRLYLKCFLDSCETMLDKSASEQRNLKLAGIRIAMLKAYLLLSASSRPVRHPAKDSLPQSSELASEHQRFVEQVISARSLIERLLDDYDTNLIRAVREDYERRSRYDRRGSVRSAAIRTLLLCAGFGLLGTVVVFVLWVVLFR